MSFSQHPNSDKLKLTRVDVGSDDLLDIVCGAPNIRIDKVVVAPVNSDIPDRGKPFQIKETKIR